MKIPKGSKTIIVPSIPGQTFELPDGFLLLKEHCGVNLNMKRGAYIGPCPGIGNLYYVTIKAIYKATGSKGYELLGNGRLELGTYKY